MTHNYNWTKTLISPNCYTVSWYDGQTLLCSTQTKIIGPEAEVETALSFAAEQLRKENAVLFPEDVEELETDGISTMNMEEEIYG